MRRRCYRACCSTSHTLKLEFLKLLHAAAMCSEGYRPEHKTPGLVIMATVCCTRATAACLPSVVALTQPVAAVID